MIAHNSNARIQETEIECDFKDSQGYTVRPCPKNKQTTNNLPPKKETTKVKLLFDLYIIADSCFVSGLHFQHLAMVN